MIRFQLTSFELASIFYRTLFTVSDMLFVNLCVTGWAVTFKRPCRILSAPYLSSLPSHFPLLTRLPVSLTAPYFLVITPPHPRLLTLPPFLRLPSSVIPPLDTPHYSFLNYIDVNLSYMTLFREAVTLAGLSLLFLVNRFSL